MPDQEKEKPAAPTAVSETLAGPASPKALAALEESGT